MFFQIVGSVAIAAFLGYVAWQIQRVSERMDYLSERIDALDARMGTMSDSLNARMEAMSRSLNADMITMSNSLNARMNTITIDLGETKGKIEVILQRLDENDKAHGELGQRIEELAVAIQKQ